MFYPSLVEPTFDKCGPNVTDAGEILREFQPKIPIPTQIVSSSGLPSAPKGSVFDHALQQFFVPTTTSTCSSRNGNNIHCESRQATDFDIEVLRQYFHLPLKEAARRLGSCEAVLKRVCRRKQIKRWPYRKVAAKLAKIHFLSKCLVHAEGHQVDRLQQRIQTYTQEYHDIMQGKGVIGNYSIESRTKPSEQSLMGERSVKVEHPPQARAQVQSPTSVSSRVNSLKMILDDCSVLGSEHTLAIHI